MSAFVLLAVLAALYVACALLLDRFALRRLTCERAFSRPAFFEGEEGEMIETVRNDKPLLIPWLRLESRVSPHIRLGSQENLLVSEERYMCSLFAPMPFQQIRRRHRVRFLRRGAYDLGNATLTAGDPLGLIQTTREQRMRVPVLVYPRLLTERELSAPLSMLMQETVSRRFLLTDPFLVRGIRPYQIGDPVRDIHWSASARTGQTQVRLHDYTATARLMVLLNGERYADQWSDTLMDYETDAIEAVIRAAATLCVRALRAGISVGFAANMPQGDDRESTVLPPAGGIAREEELLAAFARLRVVRTESFSRLLGGLHDLSGVDVVALSCYDSPAIQDAMRALRARGSSARLHVLSPREVGAA